MITVEEKIKMYRKLNKDEIINMLIEANRQLSNLTVEPKITYQNNSPQKVPYHEVCGCEVCHCTIGNRMVDLNGRGEYVTTTNITTS